ncbi:hypothetical protein BH10ACT11_BH10ACT11_03850 [soil metagenome]
MKSGKLGILLALGALAALPAGTASAGGSRTVGFIAPIHVGKFKVQPGGTGGGATRERRGISFPQSVFAEVRKDGSSATYIGEASKVTDDVMTGKFGGFGKIDVRFHKTGPYKSEKLPRNCEGTATKRQKGEWRGVFKFAGEGGIGKVTRHKLPGARIKLGNITGCSGGPHTFVDLDAATKMVSFFASERKKAGAKPQFYADRIDHKRGAEIRRTTYMGGKPADFKYASDLSSATVKPGGQFTGTGRYEAVSMPRGVGTGTNGALTGNLKVHFLGRRGKNSLRTSEASLRKFTVTPLRRWERLHP